PVRMVLRLRVPFWTAPGGSVAVNGRTDDLFAAPGSYVVLDRTWRDGDRVELTLPMQLHVQPMPDDPTVQAVMYGPLVLVGRLGTEGLTPDILRAEPTKPRTVPEYKGDPVSAPSFVARGNGPGDWIKPVPGRSLEFRTVGQTRDVTLVPFYTLIDERYATYWIMGSDPLTRRDLLKVLGAAGAGAMLSRDAAAQHADRATAPGGAARALPILPLTSTSDVFAPPRGRAYDKFSFDFPEPSVAVGALRFAFLVFTYENAYAMDPRGMNAVESAD